MEGADLLLAGVLFLFSAVVAVPLAARLGIGAVSENIASLGLHRSAGAA